MQNPSPLNLTFLDVKKFDTQNLIIGKIATQVKASILTEDQLTKKNLMQDQVADIENRLEKLKQTIKMDSDDNGSAGGGGDGSGDGGLPPTPGRRYKPHPPRPASRPEKDSYDELMDRYKKFRRPKYYPPCSPRPLPRPPPYSAMAYLLTQTPSDLQHLRSKATGRPSYIPEMRDTPPLTRIRDDYFPPPPVHLADDSFTLPVVLNKPPIPPKPVVTKPPIPPKPVLDTFSRPLTKIIDSKKIKYK